MLNFIQKLFKKDPVYVDIDDMIMIWFKGGRKVKVYPSHKMFFVDLLYMWETEGEIRKYKVLKKGNTSE